MAGPAKGDSGGPGNPPAALALDGEDVCVREEAADRMRAEPAHAALDGAVSGARGGARPRIPALAVDLQLRLAGGVAQQPRLATAGVDRRLPQGNGSSHG